MQFGFSGATASPSHLRILPLLCAIEESPSLKMYGHKLWQSPAVGRAGRAKFGSLDQTGSKTDFEIYEDDPLLRAKALDGWAELRKNFDVSNKPGAQQRQG